MSKITSGPTAIVPKDPQPSVDRIDDLARRILTGDILLPKFQRDFVWEKHQIIKLLDSVYKNYPIGSVLLWQSRLELRSENRIADLEINLPKPDYPVNYLLDGQQRLSTICGAMYWHGENEESKWNILFDLRKEEFFHVSTLNDLPLHQIRLNKLGDASSFYKHIASLDTLGAKDIPKLKEVADKLFNRFKDYKIASVTLGDMSIDDVAPIFERINSTGTRLTIVDLMRAATWSQDFDLVETIDNILAELSIKEFGGIEKKTILRNMSAASGGGFSIENINNLRNKTIDELKDAAAETLEATKKAVDYLKTQIKIPNDNIIPYLNQFVVLTELFRQIQRPSGMQYSEITKWFWRSSLSGYFAGWNTGMMNNDLAELNSFILGDTNELNIYESRPTVDIWKKRTFRANNAHSKLYAIILAYQSPVDLLTGQKIDLERALSWVNQKEFHHFFPQAYLKTIGVSSNKINSLANIILLTSSSNKFILDKSPSEYLIEVEKAAGSNLERWLQSNLIPIDAYIAAKNNDFEKFIEIRADAIHEKVLEHADWT
jgi:hypothetical protein